LIQLRRSHHTISFHYFLLYFPYLFTILSESSCVRNLGGFFFDQTLSMEQHASAITKSCFHQIRNIEKIRSYITVDAYCQLLARQQCYEHAEVWIQLRRSHHTLTHYHNPFGTLQESILKFCKRPLTN
jgi:hypothetical protein